MSQNSPPTTLLRESGPNIQHFSGSNVPHASHASHVSVKNAEASEIVRKTLTNVGLIPATLTILNIDPIRWMEENFYLYDTGDPLEIFPCQEVALREALRRDPDTNKFIYNTVLWSWPKKSAKSTIVAAVVHLIASNVPRARIRLVANDLKQADSRVGMYLRESIKLNPNENGPLPGQPGKRGNRIKISTSGFTLKYPNGSIVEMVPIDPSGEAGGNDDLIVYSELWGWASKAHQKMWSEMTLSPNKFGESQRWIDTYAGHSGESPILEQLYDQGVNRGQVLSLPYHPPTPQISPPSSKGGMTDDMLPSPSAEPYATQRRDTFAGENIQGHQTLSDNGPTYPNEEVYANVSARLLAVWVTKHLLPWQTSADGQAYYASEEKNLTANEYLRMHFNRWVTKVDQFVAKEWWEACNRPDQIKIPLLNSLQEVVIAADAGVSSDNFAVTAVTRTEDLHTGVIYTNNVYFRIWEPPSVNSSIVFSNVENFDDPDTPEGMIRKLCRDWNVVKIVYDQFQLHDMMTRLRQEGIADILKFDQNQRRNVADKFFHDIIRNRSYRHRGDPALTLHVMNANKETNNEKMRIVKRNPNDKIDGAVAESMAVHEAYRLNLS